MAPAGGGGKGAAQQKQGDSPKPGGSEAPRQRLEAPANSPLVKKLLLQPEAALLAPPTQRPAIGAPPASELLGRLQQFLPAMQSANAELASHPGAEPLSNFLDVKTRQDSEGEDSDDDSAAEPRIVMDLACGVFDLKDDAAVAAAARQMSGVAAGTDMQREDSDATSSSGSDDDSDDDSEAGAGDGGDAGLRASVPLDTEMSERQGASRKGGNAAGSLSKKKQRQRGRRGRIEEL